MYVILKTYKRKTFLICAKNCRRKNNQFSQFFLLRCHFGLFFPLFMLRVILGNCIVTFAYLNVTMIYKVHANIFILLVIVVVFLLFRFYYSSSFIFMQVYNKKLPPCTLLHFKYNKGSNI